MAIHLSLWWLAAIPGIGVVLFAHFICYGAYIEGELERCRYSKALKMLDGPLLWRSTASYQVQRANALFYSGRAPEAETTLRKLVAPGRSKVDRVIGFENLGRVLLAQGRYQEARETFETAARMWRSSSMAFSGLAELRLLQGTGPGLALRDAEKALELYLHTPTEWAGRERAASIRGNQAWALALQGYAAESKQAIEAGIREMEPKYLPEVAGFYWRAGMAMQALEDPAADGYFRRAVDLDPQGYYGGLARQHLA